MSSISDTSVWLKFFTEAGIPAGDATNYAIIFTDNRIKMDMLLDLNREYLRDMGITVMGDIIAILKHAKVHSGQLSRQRVMQASNPKSDTTTPPPAVKKSTPATRMLEHYVRKDGPPPSPPLSTNVSSRLGSGTKRSHEDDDLLSNKRSSVFNRLGDNSVTSTTNDSPKITITMHGKDILRTPDQSKKTQPSVFGRLVYKDEEENEEEGEKDVSPGKPLEYQGILKYPSKEGGEKGNVVRKVTAVDGGVTKTNKVATMRADTTTGVKSRLGVQRTNSNSTSAGIFARENDEAAKKVLKSPVKSPASTTFKQLKAKVTAAAIKKSTLQARDVSGAPPASSSNISPPASPSATPGKKFVKKIVRVNKKTGEIVSEEKIPLKTDVFSRLGN